MSETKIKDAIRRIRFSAKYDTQSQAVKKALETGAVALEKQTPKELTVDELRQMDGQPVWAQLIHSNLRKRSLLHKNDVDGWYIISCSSEFSVLNEPYALKVDDKTFFSGKGYLLQEALCYGETWIAYNQPPKVG